MKKEEAILISKQKSDLILECVDNILNNYLRGKFDISKDNNYLYLDIYVPEKEYKRHFNLEITSEYSELLYKQVMTDLWDKFYLSDVFGITKLYTVGNINNIFSGISIYGLNKSEIKINFGSSSWFLAWEKEYNSNKKILSVKQI